MKRLIHITALTKKDTRVDLYYYSIKQAKFFNPSLRNFEISSNQNIYIWVLTYKYT